MLFLAFWGKMIDEIDSLRKEEFNMYQFPIGVIIDSFRTDTRTAIEKAAALGAQGIQMYSTKGENSPENLTPAKRRELLDIVKSNGLRFSALAATSARASAIPNSIPS